jgi:hypothetical protein
MNENNELVGFDIEWGKIISEGFSVKTESVTGQFAGLTPGLYFPIAQKTASHMQ